MQAQFPGVPVRLDHFRLAGHVFIIVVRHVPLPHKRLEVGPELHAVRRIHINHLHLPAQAFVVQQRVHHHERIPENHPVHPLVGIFIRLQHLIGDGTLGITKQVVQILLLVGLVPGQRFDDGFGGEPLVDKQRQRGNVKRKTLRLTCPVQKRFADGFQPAQRLFGLMEDVGNVTLSLTLTLPSPGGRGERDSP